MFTIQKFLPRDKTRGLPKGKPLWTVRKSFLKTVDFLDDFYDDVSFKHSFYVEDAPRTGRARRLRKQFVVLRATYPQGNARRSGFPVVLITSDKPAELAKLAEILDGGVKHKIYNFLGFNPSYRERI